MNTEAQSAIPLQVKRRRTIRVFNLITSTLLVFALLGTAGVFLYRDVVVKQREDARQKLDEMSAAQGDRNLNKIEEIRVYDNKLNIARTLIDNHLSPVALLTEIEKNTKATIQYTDLEYTYDPGYEAMLTLSGATEMLSSVALQKMQVLKDGLFSEFMLSDITMTTDTLTGTVPADVATEEQPPIGFQVKGVFKKSLIEYTGNTQGVRAFPATQATETVTSGMSPSSTTPAVSESSITTDTL